MYLQENLAVEKNDDIIVFSPQYSIPGRRKRWKCVFGLLSLTFTMYVGMKPGQFMAEDEGRREFIKTASRIRD